MEYTKNYLWYTAVNYIVAVVEQVLLWNYASRTFFWIALILNVAGCFGASIKLSKLEKKFGLVD
jgi:hypothetical protein